MDASGDSTEHTLPEHTLPLPPSPPPPQRVGHRPLLTPTQALYLAKKLYGIKCMCEMAPPPPLAPGGCTCSKELPSYDDRNFLISGIQAGGDQRPELHGAGARASNSAAADGPCVILKVHNSNDSDRGAQLQAMDEAMRRLQAAGVPTNVPLQPVVWSGEGPPAAADREAAQAAVPCRMEARGAGDERCWAYLPCTCHPEVEGQWHVTRCLTFVPGRMLSSVQSPTPTLLRSLGSLMGRVTHALAGWQPSALVYQHDWHPEHGAEVVRRLAPTITSFGPERRSLLLAIADQMDDAAPRLGAVPRQACHADANDDNVVTEDGTRAVGIIDFGDMAVMPRVCEPAIAMLYTILLALDRPVQTAGAATNASTETDDDAATLTRLLAAASHVLAGYTAAVPLSAEELSLLPLLMRSRLAQSLTLGASSVQADPNNAPYLLQTQRPGWRVIRLLMPGAVMTEGAMLQLLTRA